MNTNEKESYYNYLVESAKAIIKGGKLYGFEIDENNLRDLVAALYALYLNESVMTKETKREMEFDV